MEERDVVINIESSTNTISETRIPEVADDKDGSILFSSTIYSRPMSGDELLGEHENPVKSTVGGVSPKKEKRMSMSAKKPPKPPRPPRGLSLDAADQKLIKEIAELAMIKRARNERIKALKKMKAAKATSSASASSIGNFIAMMFTILFCIVILFQGCPSGILPRNGLATGITTSHESNIHVLPGVGSPQVTQVVPVSGNKDGGRKDATTFATRFLNS